MKKILILALALLLLLPLLAGCDTAENDSPPANDDTNDVPGDTSSANDNDEPGDDTIRGPVTYKDFSIEQLLTDSLENILEIVGEPMEERGIIYIFDNGLEFVAFGLPEEPLESVGVRNGEFFDEPENLHLLVINGVSMNLSRSEIIAEFGEPNEQHSQSVTYRIVSDDIEVNMYIVFSPEGDQDVIENIQFSIPTEGTR